jgi:MoaA/NifB/PqqE/SkfB family radical SAM enzyme
MKYTNKKLKFIRAVLFANLFKVKTPLNVMWNITNKCNAQCTYCRQPFRLQRELSTRQVFQIIDQMVAAGTQRIGFVGGEPLCRKDIGAIIGYCKEKNLYVTLVSNGAFVRDRISGLKKLDYLILSLDGDKKTHEKNRPVGSYDEVLKAIKVARKYVPLMTNTVLSRTSQNSIDFILDLSRKYSFIPHFNVIQGMSSHIPSDNYHACITKLILRKKHGYMIANSFRLLQYYASWDNFKVYRSYQRKFIFPYCWAGKLFCNIDVSGRIGHCILRSYTGAHVLKSGFKDAFNRLKEIKCRSCTCANLVEYNYMFSLDIGVILDWIKIIGKSENQINLRFDKI